MLYAKLTDWHTLAHIYPTPRIPFQIEAHKAEETDLFVANRTRSHYKMEFVHCMSFVRFQLGLIDVCISCMCAVCTRYPSISMLIPYNSLPAQTCHTVRIHAHIKSACFFSGIQSIEEFLFFCISLLFKHSACEYFAVVWFKCDISPQYIQIHIYAANASQTSHSQSVGFLHSITISHEYVLTFSYLRLCTVHCKFVCNCSFSLSFWFYFFCRIRSCALWLMRKRVREREAITTTQSALKTN